MGDLRDAETAYKEIYEIYDEDEYRELYDTPYFMGQAAQRLRALSEYVTPGTEKSFEDSEWDGYAKAATAEPFILMRKGAHNVLCKLRWLAPEYKQAVIDWTNEKAVYQGDRVPIMKMWWHHNGEIEFVYTANKPAPGEPDSQTYWFECDEETEEWVFVRVEYNYRQDTENAYSGFDSLWMTALDGRLIMDWVEYRHDGDFDYVGTSIADMPYDEKAYTLNDFDIMRCDADFSLLRQMGESAVLEE